MKKTICLLFLLVTGHATAQSNERSFFIGYETLEMVMNEFKYFAGEVGYRYQDDRQLRLSIIEVELTERHLSSDWEAYAVDGPDVKGYLRGYELNHDWFFTKRWYVSANIGYFQDKYEHTKLDETVRNETFTIGSGIGFLANNLFGVNHLYLNFANPIRYYFNQIDKTKLGKPPLENM